MRIEVHFYRGFSKHYCAEWEAAYWYTYPVGSNKHSSMRYVMRIGDWIKSEDY